MTILTNHETHSHRRHIVNRTMQLKPFSRFLYRIEHYSSVAGIAILIPSISIGVALTVFLLDFPSHWVAGFVVCAAVITIIMLFTIQHTQVREQSATQRKLDELIRAVPGAAESLMMLEEAPTQFIKAVEDDQRAAKSDSDDHLIVRLDH